MTDAQPQPQQPQPQRAPAVLRLHMIPYQDTTANKKQPGAAAAAAAAGDSTTTTAKSTTTTRATNRQSLSSMLNIPLQFQHVAVKEKRPVVGTATKEQSVSVALSQSSVETPSSSSSSSWFIGRDGSKCCLVLLHKTLQGGPLVSRCHCRLSFRASDGSYGVSDLGSLNGTFVNNVKIHSAPKKRPQPDNNGDDDDQQHQQQQEQEYVLHDGDLIQFGSGTTVEAGQRAADDRLVVGFRVELLLPPVVAPLQKEQQQVLQKDQDQDQEQSTTKKQQERSSKNATPLRQNSQKEKGKYRKETPKKASAALEKTDSDENAANNSNGTIAAAAAQQKDDAAVATPAAVVVASQGERGKNAISNSGSWIQGKSHISVSRSSTTTTTTKEQQQDAAPQQHRAHNSESADVQLFPAPPTPLTNQQDLIDPIVFPDDAMASAQQHQQEQEKRKQNDGNSVAATSSIPKEETSLPKEIEQTRPPLPSVVSAPTPSQVLALGSSNPYLSGNNIDDSNGGAIILRKNTSCSSSSGGGTKKNASHDQAAAAAAVSPITPPLTPPPGINNNSSSSKSVAVVSKNASRESGLDGILRLLHEEEELSPRLPRSDPAVREENKKKEAQKKKEEKAEEKKKHAATAKQSKKGSGTGNNNNTNPADTIAQYLTFMKRANLQAGLESTKAVNQHNNKNSSSSSRKAGGDGERASSASAMTLRTASADVVASQRREEEEQQQHMSQKNKNKTAGATTGVTSHCHSSSQLEKTRVVFKESSNPFSYDVDVLFSEAPPPPPAATSGSSSSSHHHQNKKNKTKMTQQQQQQEEKDKENEKQQEGEKEHQQGASSNDNGNKSDNNNNKLECCARSLLDEIIHSSQTPNTSSSNGNGGGNGSGGGGGGKAASAIISVASKSQTAVVASPARAAKNDASVAKHESVESKKKRKGASKRKKHERSEEEEEEGEEQSEINEHQPMILHLSSLPDAASNNFRASSLLTGPQQQQQQPQHVARDAPRLCIRGENIDMLQRLSQSQGEALFCSQDCIILAGYQSSGAAQQQQQHHHHQPPPPRHSSIDDDVNLLLRAATKNKKQQRQTSNENSFTTKPYYNESQQQTTNNNNNAASSVLLQDNEDLVVAVDAELHPLQQQQEQHRSFPSSVRVPSSLEMVTAAMAASQAKSANFVPIQQTATGTSATTTPVSAPRSADEQQQKSNSIPLSSKRNNNKKLKTEEEAAKKKKKQQQQQPNQQQLHHHHRQEDGEVGEAAANPPIASVEPPPLGVDDTAWEDDTVHNDTKDEMFQSQFDITRCRIARPVVYHPSPSRTFSEQRGVEDEATTTTATGGGKGKKREKEAVATKTAGKKQSNKAKASGVGARKQTKLSKIFDMLDQHGGLTHHRKVSSSSSAAQKQQQQHQQHQEQKNYTRYLLPHNNIANPGDYPFAFIPQSLFVLLMPHQIAGVRFVWKQLVSRKEKERRERQLLAQSTSLARTMENASEVQEEDKKNATRHNKTFSAMMDEWLYDFDSSPSDTTKDNNNSDEKKKKKKQQDPAVARMEQQATATATATMPAASTDASLPAGCITAHRMGLGKSLTTIAFISTYWHFIDTQRAKFGWTKEQTPPFRVVLVVPKAVLFHWIREWSTWNQRAKLAPVSIYCLSGDSKSNKKAIVEEWMANPSHAVLLLTHRLLASIMHESSNSNGSKDEEDQKGGYIKDISVFETSAAAVRAQQQEGAKKKEKRERTTTKKEQAEEEHEDTKHNATSQQGQRQQHPSDLESNLMVAAATTAASGNVAVITSSPSSSQHQQQSITGSFWMIPEADGGEVQAEEEFPPEQDAKSIAKKNKEGASPRKKKAAAANQNDGIHAQYAFIRDALLNSTSLLVVDEAHKIYPPSGALATALECFPGSVMRLALTGTPCSSSLHQFYTLLQFVQPMLRGRRDLNEDVLREALSQSMQTCSFSVIRPLMPKIFVYRVFVHFSPTQLRLYNALLEHLAVGGGGDAKHEAGEKVATANVATATKGIIPVSSMLQCASFAMMISNHTQLVADWFVSRESESNMLGKKRSKKRKTEGGDDGHVGEQQQQHAWARPALYVPENLEQSIEHNPKLKVALHLIHLSMSRKEKVVVFSHSVQSLKIIELYLKGFQMTRGREFDLIDGSVSAETRDGIASRFNQPVTDENGEEGDANENCDDDDEAPLMVLLLSISSCGTGAEFTGASRVILYDLCWLSSAETQSISRVYRFGQTKHISVVSLLCDNPIEEHVAAQDLPSIWRKGDGNNDSNNTAGSGASLQRLRVASSRPAAPFEHLGEPLTPICIDDDGMDGEEGEGGAGENPLWWCDDDAINDPAIAALGGSCFNDIARVVEEDDPYQRF